MQRWWWAQEISAAPAANPESGLLDLAARSTVGASKDVGRTEQRWERGREGCERVSWTVPWSVQEPCLGNQDHPSERGKEPPLISRQTPPACQHQLGECTAMEHVTLHRGQEPQGSRGFLEADTTECACPLSLRDCFTSYTSGEAQAGACASCLGPSEMKARLTPPPSPASEPLSSCCLP